METTPYTATPEAPAPSGYPAVAYPESFAPEPQAPSAPAPDPEPEPELPAINAAPALAPPPANAPWLPSEMGPAPGAVGRTVHDTAMNPHSAATFASDSAAHNGRQTTEQTLREDGLLKAVSGVTSLDEIFRVVA